MIRLLVVAAVVALLVVARLAHRRWQASQQIAGGRLPGELVGADGTTWVVVTSPLCATCGPVLEVLRRTRPADHVVAVDVAERADLAAALDVRAAPTVLRSGPDGLIDLRLAGPAAASEFFSLATA